MLVLSLRLRLCQKFSSVKRQNVSAIVSAKYEPSCLRRLCEGPCACACACAYVASVKQAQLCVRLLPWSTSTNFVVVSGWWLTWVPEVVLLGIGLEYCFRPASAKRESRSAPCSRRGFTLAPGLRPVCSRFALAGLKRYSKTIPSKTTSGTQGRWWQFGSRQVDFQSYPGKWRHERSSRLIRNLSNCEREAWKKFRLQRDSNPWPLRYRCSALPTELWSHNCWEQVNFFTKIDLLPTVMAS